MTAKTEQDYPFINSYDSSKANVEENLYFSYIQEAIKEYAHH